MIGFVEGTIVQLEPVQAARNPSTYWITIGVQGVGYDVQVTSRSAQSLRVADMALVFTHLQVRDDQMVLFGFSTKAERDLFRQLIQVSGIGPQMAMALLHALGLTDLVQAIVTSNTRVLCLAPGIGTKTAERLCLELKSKLSNSRSMQIGSAPALNTTIQTDLEMTLLALGYTPKEIVAALKALMNMPNLLQTDPLEEWIRASIGWLSTHESEI